MDLPIKVIQTIRLLSADMVERAKSGHPGAPMGLAPLAYILFVKHLRANPSNSQWWARDRFVLSNGHACALQYSMLHLLGYKLSMDDLKAFRQLDSRTPGHPEAHMTDGVEVTTGPLGQGVANAVGLAMAQAHLAATFGRSPKYEHLFDNYTFCILGDGCMQEGVASEAMSLAGHLKLNKLIFLYDDNRIQIDGDTELAFTENVMERMKSYGFHVIEVENGDSDLASLDHAISEAKASKERPTLIKIRTTIGIGSEHQGTEKVHGAPLGIDQVKAVKRAFGFDENATFHVPPDVARFFADLKISSEKLESEWNALFASYAREYPDLAAELTRRFAGHLPVDWQALLPTYSPLDAPAATRKLSENVLNAIAHRLPELMGGSADLTGSNLTRWKTAIDFQHPSSGLGSYCGRYVRFGVREHAMCGIVNGLAAYGGFLPFGATFLNFISYGLGSVRLSCLSHFRALFIMTHDSIGLGEDGPTHQPVETLAGLRALPNILVLRPADGNEVSGAYAVALENGRRPSVLCLSRQNLPHLKGTSVASVARGAYVLNPEIENPDIILLSTGSEVSVVVEAKEILATQNVTCRVVSMPCCELYDEQPIGYKLAVFLPNVPVLSLEALSTHGWSRYAHASIGMTNFGTSAPYKHIYEKLGFTGSKVAEKALATIEFFKTHPIARLTESPF